MTDRQIWFERWLWSYMPIHWKGWAVVAAFVGAGMALVFLCLQIATMLGREDFGFAGFIIIPLLIFGFDPFMRRHSKGWRE